ncbi:MAG: ABC transporter permease [Anaerolineales bacterium]|nr:ABC transporter permease [Anaerolineales bacterium]
MSKVNSGNLFVFLVENLIWVLVLVALIVFSLLSDKFLTPFNMVNLLVRVAALGLLVIGQSFTLITGNFDLSSESTMGLTAMVGGLMIASTVNGGLGWEVNPLIAIAVMIVLGCAIGWINGTLITKFKMNNFIVTVAMLMILRGVTYAISPGQSTSFFPELFDFLGSGSVMRIQQATGRFLPIPAAAIFLILMFAVSHVVTRYRRFGRNMYAVGSNRSAADAAGIDSQRVILLVYIVSGLFAALAGLLEAGRMDSATPRMGSGMIFSVQAAAVIGGISLFGGRGTLIGAFGGVLLWGILDTGLNMLQVSPFWIEVSRGLLLLFAVFLDAMKVRYLHRIAVRKALTGNTIGLQDPVMT